MLVRYCNIVPLMLVCLCSFSTVCCQNTIKGWINKKADVYFVLDCSSSIWIVDYMTQRNFVSGLVADMDIGPSLTRVGVGLFSDKFVSYIPINNTLSKDQLRNQITQAPYNKGDAYLSRGLEGLRLFGLPRSLVRQEVPLIAVLITDGKSRYKQLTADNATLIKNENIFMFTVGIGNDVDVNELRFISSDPKSIYAYLVPDFDSLNSTRSILSSSMSEVTLFLGDEGTCGDKVRVDAVFVYDAADVGEKVSKTIKTFINSVVQNVSMNSGNVRIGVVSKTCHEGDIILGQYLTKENLATGLQDNNGPEISSLVKRARLNSFSTENGARQDAKRRIILILNSDVVKKREMTNEVARAKYEGMEMFVIRLGNDYVKTYINSLASSEANAMYPGTADDLISSESKETFVRSFCKDL